MCEIIPSKPQQVCIIADDVSSNRLLLKVVVESNFPDLQVLEASDGKQAVRITNAAFKSGYEIHSILMDYMMPEMNGDDAMTEICALLKKETGKTARELCHGKLIMVTASREYKGKDFPCEHCSGCVRKIMYKPVDLKMLKKLLK